MKKFNLCLILLIMAFNCKADNSTTTTISPTVVTTTPTLPKPSTSSTAPPTTKTTLPPATTTTETISTTTAYVETFDYKVCGNVTLKIDCSCSQNGYLYCTPSNDEDYYWWYWRKNPPFKSTNLKIMNESFVVKQVKFYENSLTTLQKGKVLPGNEGTVEIMNLQSNNIYYIDNGTFDNFTALKELDLTYNFLTNVSGNIFTKEFGSILQKLNLNENSFTSIAALDFSNLGELKDLSLYGNSKLGSNDSFSKYIFPKSLKNLTVLNLAKCGITFLGDEVFINLMSLKTLYLYRNPLTTFPKTIYVLDSLEFLDLDGTSITVLNNSISGNLTTNLQKLYMVDSSLTMIDDCAFCTFTNLTELRLYRNGHLSYIHENAFGYAYNEISPPSLESFSIEHCNLSTIPEDLLNWHNVTKIGLGGNPFICNCSMAWLINDLMSPTHSMNLQNIAPGGYGSSDFQCSGPYGLKGISFAQLSKNFCPNEVKRECKKVQEKIVTELPSPFYISWFHICVGIVLICFGIILGMTILPLFRLCCSRQKKEIIGFSNQNFPDDLVDEDFDEC